MGPNNLATLVVTYLLIQSSVVSAEDVIPVEPSSNDKIGMDSEDFKSIENIKYEQVESKLNPKIFKLSSASEEKSQNSYQSDASEANDGSYAFGYDLHDQSRHEESDSEGNVKGYYSYVDDKGIVRKVEYTAGPDKGFVVLKKKQAKSSKRPRKIKKLVRKRPSKTNDQKETSSSLEDNNDTPSKEGKSKPKRKKLIKIPRDKVKKPSLNLIEQEISKYDNDFYDLDSEFNTYPGFPYIQEIEGEKPTKEVSDSDEKKKPVLIVKVRRPKNFAGQSAFVPPGIFADCNHDSLEPVRIENTYEDSTEVADSVVAPSAFEEKKGKRKTPSEEEIKGTYTIVNDEGVKSRLHYIAGGATGFKVLAPIAYEAIPSFFIANADPIPVATSSISLPAVQLAPRPSAVVYHVRPESPWKPWEGVRGYTKVIRKSGSKSKSSENLQDFVRSSTENSVEIDKSGRKPIRRVLRKRVRPNVRRINRLLRREHKGKYESNEVRTGSESSIVAIASTTEAPTTTTTEPPRRHAPLRSYTASEEKYRVEEFPEFQFRERFIYSPPPFGAGYKGGPSFPLSFESVKIINRGSVPNRLLVPEESINRPAIASAEMGGSMETIPLMDEAQGEMPMIPQSSEQLRQDMVPLEGKEKLGEVEIMPVVNYRQMSIPGREPAFLGSDSKENAKSLEKQDYPSGVVETIHIQVHSSSEKSQKSSKANMMSSSQRLMKKLGMAPTA